MSMFDALDLRMVEQRGQGLPPPPEPPETTATSFHFDPSEWVALNPQPLPPEPPEQIPDFGRFGFLVEEGFEQTTPAFLLETDFQDLSASPIL